MEGSYHSIGTVMKFLRLMQVLEIIHPLLGYSQGSTLFTGAQLFYRMFILIVMIDGEPRMQTKPVIFYLFWVWTTVELVR